MQDFKIRKSFFPSASGLTPTSPPHQHKFCSTWSYSQSLSPPPPPDGDQAVQMLFRPRGNIETIFHDDDHRSNFVLTLIGKVSS